MASSVPTIDERGALAPALPDDTRCLAALDIKGEHFPCELRQGQHDGWAHQNRAAGAIWCSDLDPLPGMLGSAHAG